MLNQLKRWFTTSQKPKPPDPGDLEDWAHARRYTVRPVHDDSGLVIEGRTGVDTWRLEWGPAQRRYVQGQELRLRADLSFGSELQLLVISRQLQEAMESTVFEQYVEGVQTRIDDNTPPEMRWLVMFPALSGTELGPLREHFHAVGNSKSWLQQWLDGALATSLAAMPHRNPQPMVLMIGRGRLLLRTQCNEPSRQAVDAWVKVFETALREARRVATQTASANAPSTQPSLWSANALPTSDDPVS